MSTATYPKVAGQRRGVALRSLRVTSYDKVASMLLSLLALIGLVVFCMFIAWLSTRVVPPRPSIQLQRIEQVGGGISSGIVGESMQLDSPTWQDVAAESDVVEPAFQETVSAVLDAVATRQADLSDPRITEDFEVGRGGTQQIGTGNRPGYGHGPGKPGIPPHERWDIRWGEGEALMSYAKKLDFFNIELGVLGKGSDVTTITGLATSQPKVNTISRAERQTWLYWSWKQSARLEADLNLAQRAGVSTVGKKVIQFYPDMTEQLLLNLEVNFRGLQPSQVRRTAFEVVPDGNGYAFEVVEQIPL